MARRKEWTLPQRLSHIRVALRTLWLRSPMRYEALVAAKVKEGRKLKGYTCARCGRIAKDVVVDHIVRAGRLKTYGDLPGFAARMFCASKYLQVLCKPCDRVKAEIERGESKSKAEHSGKV